MVGMERKLDSMKRIILPPKARQALGEKEQMPLERVFFYVLGSKVFLSAQNEEMECAGPIRQEAIQTVQNMLERLPLKRVMFWCEIIDKVEKTYFVNTGNSEI